jgi:hypothetical protein
MMHDSATLELLGEQIPLAAFADAMGRFRAIIAALSAEVPGGTSIEWFVDDLSRGSATATIRGEAKSPSQELSVEQVVTAFDSLGASLAEDDLGGYGPKIVREARGLADILNGKIEALVFQTARRESIIRKQAKPTLGVPVEWKAVQVVGAFGAIEGRVQTLTSRGSLRFMLYDTLNDRAVNCFVDEGQQPMMRDIWGKRAIVEGWVSRDPKSGRPLAIRQITSITALSEREPGSYRDARGVLPLKPGGLLPEDAIRRVRDV